MARSSATRRAREETAPSPPGTPYEQDFYTWTLEQAELLRAGRLDTLDLANLAEEVGDLGKEVFRQLVSAYRVILIHMLKWEFQPERRSRSWTTSIKTQRVAVEQILRDNPGLKSRVAQAHERAYQRARIEASGETDLDEDIFPVECPYTPDEIMTRPYPWPEA